MVVGTVWERGGRVWMGKGEECLSGRESVEGKEEEYNGGTRVPYSGKFSNNANFVHFI